MDIWNPVVGRWFSRHLGQEMPIVSYGQWGYPLLLFSKVSPHRLEQEREDLLQAIEAPVRTGEVRVFAVASLDDQSWRDDSLPVWEKADRQARYSRYVEEEVVEHIHQMCQWYARRIAVAGVGFGAFHAANALFRRPDLFDSFLGVTGFYDLGPSYLHGFCDDNSYFNNPAWFLPGLEGQLLDLLKTACRIRILTHERADESLEASRWPSVILQGKGIPHAFDILEDGAVPRWPWWSAGWTGGGGGGGVF